MNCLKSRGLLVLVVLQFVNFSALADDIAPPPELPLEAFFQEPSFSALAFSPDGKRVLCVVPFERRRNLAVIDLEQGTKKLLTNFEDRHVDQPMWASNDRILFHVDRDGQESVALYSVNRDGSEPTVLATGHEDFNTTRQVNERFHRLLRRPLNDPQNILVTARLTHADWLDVARMNLRTGKMTVIARPPGNVEYYVLDRQDVVRLAVVDDGTIRRVLYRDRDGAEWREIDSRSKDQAGWEPMGFDGDNRTLFISSSIGRKTAAVFRYDTTEQVITDLVVADETYSTAGKLYYDPSKKKVVGLSYEADRQRFYWLDEEMRALHAKLETSLPDTVHDPVQFSEDGNRIIIYSRSDRDAGVYYLYERARQKLSEIAVVMPGLDPAQMAPMTPIEYRARDGLNIHGYLTLPVGRKPEQLPLIIHPHGGPYGIRDKWEFVSEVQYYANRGFAVLQINFRGSGGYGSFFEAAGFQKWGLEMQNDLSDGVKWAVERGIADPKRVVISGASYGGYAAMAGLVYTPELYCAGINYVGVVDISTLVPRGQAERRMYWMKTRLGDPGSAADRERMHKTSPVNFADNIRVPVLMAYGKNDPRVKIEHAYSIASALKKADRPYELMIVKDEGHGFRKEENRLEFFGRVDAFLKRHVPGIDRN